MATPKLRFKEFDGDWTVLKIKDLVKSLDAGVSVNSEDVEPKEDEYSVLKTSCISSGYFDENERKRVLQDIEIQRLKEPVLDDSILMSRMNTPMLVGMNAYVFKAPKNTFLPDRLWQLKINDNKTVTRWLAFYLGSDQGLNQIRDLASGTSNSMKNITKPDVLNLDLFVPSKLEQTKIASFLSAVDEKISQLTQKHALLSQYKQGMMQKLFSQQIRFKADDGSEFGEWEIKELGEILDYEQPTKYIVSSTEYKDCYKFPVLTAGKTFILGYTNEVNGIFEASKQAVIIFDDFTTAYKYVDFDFKVKSSAIKILVSKYANISYIHSALSTIDFPLGDEHKRRWISEYSKQEIPLPCLEEQTKIANFLSAIDQKIEVVAQQIEQAKTWKKGLLQQMFV